jgi:hypothetical protein
MPSDRVHICGANQTYLPMESKLHREDYGRLVSSSGINVSKELMILNRDVYANSLDVLQETRIINLARIKYFIGAKTTRDTLELTH